MYLKILTITICGFALAACVSDAEFMKETQCNNLRYELNSPQNNPDQLKQAHASRHFQDMNNSYRTMNCKNLNDYFITKSH